MSEEVQEEEERGAVGYQSQASLPSLPRPPHTHQHTHPAAPPPPPPSPRRATSSSRRQTTQQTSSKLGLELFSASNDNIPQTIPPHELIDKIKQGRVKYTYTSEIMNEPALMRYFAEGRLSTERYLIQAVDRTTYKKIRNGLRRSPGDQSRYRPRIAK